jgi:hypothetical protein
MTDPRTPNGASWREAAAPGGALDPVRFRVSLMTTFPELLKELARVDASDVHEHARCLCGHIERVLALCDEAHSRRTFEYLAGALERGAPDVQNALHVSLLERLALPLNEIDRRWALSLMPASVEEAWRNAQELRERLLDDPL